MSKFRLDRRRRHEPAGVHYFDRSKFAPRVIRSIEPAFPVLLNNSLYWRGDFIPPSKVGKEKSPTKSS